MHHVQWWVWSYAAQSGLWKYPQSTQTYSQLLFNGNVIRLLNYHPPSRRGNLSSAFHTVQRSPAAITSPVVLNAISWCHFYFSIIWTCLILPGASVSQNEGLGYSISTGHRYPTCGHCSSVEEGWCSWLPCSPIPQFPFSTSLWGILLLLSARGKPTWPFPITLPLEPWVGEPLRHRVMDCI